MKVAILCEVIQVIKFVKVLEMYRVEVYNRIKQIKTIFQCFGWWDHDHGTIWIQRMQCFVFVFYICCPVSMLAGAVITNDRKESVSLTTVGIASSVHVFRLFCIIWRKSEILSFLHQVDSLTTDDREEFSRINSKLEYFITFSKCLVVSVFFALYLFLAAAALDKQLPFNIGFPLDYRTSETGYWTAFAYLAIQILYTTVICLFTVTIWYLMLIFSIKYELLGKQMQRLGIRNEANTKAIRINRLNITAEEKQNYQQDLIAAIETLQKIPE